ncbi:Endosomal protein P24B [Babesia sp. Xinjiang]|uniref:Endosomal protein P24B n=1 Tax=Babesia sp. Xinjiang TaxID=462227 RepID=UPI000A222958|nr:Endosomal protein P24B [Babesia sp. Xinjiang]ORM40551.1 Endosomal protein P24B [Babesia sp. Xinjiang]
MACGIIFIAAFVLATLGPVQGTQMDLEGEETRCFIAFASKNERMTGSAVSVPEEYAVRPFIYKVEGPTSQPSTIPAFAITNNQFEYKVPESGHYALCLSNKSHTKNTVIFNYRIETGINRDLSSLSTVDDANNVLKFAEQLLENTHIIVDRTEAYSSREQLYSQIIEDMNSRIIRWSICQMIFLVCICFFQIYYISSFFEVKSFV